MPYISQSLEIWKKIKALLEIVLSFQIQMKDNMKSLENLKI